MGETKTQNSTKHFFKYVVTSPKYRLPTWLLHTTKPYDSKHTKLRMKRSGLAVLSDSASDPYWARSNGGQEMTTDLNPDTLQLVLCWRCEVDVEGFVGNDACSDGRSGCPDGADAGYCVVVAAAVVLLLLLLSEIIRCWMKQDLPLPLTITTYH